MSDVLNDPYVEDGDQNELSLQAFGEHEANLEQDTRVEREIEAERNAQSEQELSLPHQEDSPSQIDSPNQMDFSEFTAEFSAIGSLSDESYAKLETMGYNQALVDSYISGVQAQQQLQAHQVYEQVGGEDVYKDMLDWASVHLSDEEKQWFNNDVDAGVTQRDRAVRGLYNDYIESVGSQGDLLQGTSSVSRTSKYKSISEMVADMNDPRYESDPDFRQAVQNKLYQSNL